MAYGVSQRAAYILSELCGGQSDARSERVANMESYGVSHVMADVHGR